MKAIYQAVETVAEREMPPRLSGSKLERNIHYHVGVVFLLFGILFWLYVNNYFGRQTLEGPVC